MAANPRFGVGQSLRRKEDDPLLRGEGHYIADFSPPDALHAVVVRSPHANATFTIGDLAAVRAMPGVRLILTAKNTADLGNLPTPGTIRDDIPIPPYKILEDRQVRYVGDAVAFVVADSLDQAKDAAEAIPIDWEPLPHVIGAESALAKGAPLVWPDRPGNLSFDASLGDEAATREAFAKAATVVSVKVVNQRLVTNYMDTRGVLAEYDGDRITLTLGSQGPHIIRDIIGGEVLKLPPEKMRVITPDVGGGFGTKLFPYREYALAAVAARQLRKPVRWIGERIEHFLSDSHGRDNITTARMALDDKGHFLALDIDIVADMGAYLSCYAPYIPWLGVGMATGVYDIPTAFVKLRAAYTNTVPVDAYRGAGRPEAAYVIERLVDTIARELDIAPDVLRRRNFIKPKAMPYKTPTGKLYDSGDFAAHLGRAQDMVDWAGFRKRAVDARKRGKLRGIGISTYIEACGASSPETATVKMDDKGDVTVIIGTQSSGQGHATAYAQIVADQLGLPPERVHMIQGDTDKIATGGGTGGSSSIPCGGASLAGATRKLSDQLKALAADALEASASDLEIDAGTVRVAGTDRVVSFADLASRAGPDQLTAADLWTPGEPTYPNGTHIVELDIDEDTGQVEIVNYVVVDDFGMTLNPLMLAGQVHGGAVQGIGQALMEDTVYEPSSGQLLSASLMDYALPRASDSPSFAFETHNVPCATNPLGVKGAGEAGAIGSCPAVMNAILDALWRAYRIRDLDMPATPQKIWAAMAASRTAGAA